MKTYIKPEITVVTDIHPWILQSSSSITYGGNDEGNGSAEGHSRDIFDDLGE